MSISTLFLVVILALGSPRGRYSENSAAFARYDAMSTEIANAVEDPHETLPFTGPAAKEASGIALVAIAWHESNFRQVVRDCRMTGDHGASISSFQLMKGTSWFHYSKDEICTNPQLAATLALRVLNWYDRSVSTKSLFQGYATGSWAVQATAADEIRKLFEEALASQGIKVRRKPHTTKLYADFEPPMVMSMNGNP